MGSQAGRLCYGGKSEPVGFGGVEDVVGGEFLEEEFYGLLGAGVGVELEELSYVGSGEVGGPVVGFGLVGDEPVEAKIVAEADAFEH